jgi:drug/metabolite transporter (DMT)-like permease
VLNSAVFLGLLSALSYGATDYLSGPAGRAAGVWRSLFYGELLAFCVLSAWFVIAPPAVHFALAGNELAAMAIVASGVILLASAGALTRGLMTGNLAVVAPVAATYGAITALLSAATGERISGGAALGIAVTLLGVWIVSIPPNARAIRGQAITSSGLGWAITGALGYGVGFWIQGKFAVPLLGPVVPVWLSYAVALVLIALLSRPSGVTLAVPNRSALVPVFASGACSAAGFLALSAGLATGRVTIVVVISSSASAITVLMAKLIDRAHVAWYQWLAIAIILIGLVLIKT